MAKPAPFMIVLRPDLQTQLLYQIEPVVTPYTRGDQSTSHAIWAETIDTSGPYLQMLALLAGKSTTTTVRIPHAFVAAIVGTEKKEELGFVWADPPADAAKFQSLE